MKFFREKEVIVKFFEEKGVTVKFLGEKEVTVNFSGENEVRVKLPGKKEAMVIDEDPLPSIASINIDAIDSRAMLSVKKAGKFSPSARVRKVWIPKQYLTYKYDLVAKGKVSAAREKGKNARYLYHPFEDSKQEAKNKNFSKGNIFSPKERYFLQGEGA